MILTVVGVCIISCFCCFMNAFHEFHSFKEKKIHLMEKKFIMSQEIQISLSFLFS